MIVDDRDSHVDTSRLRSTSRLAKMSQDFRCQDEESPFLTHNRSAGPSFILLSTLPPSSSSSFFSPSSALRYNAIHDPTDSSVRLTVLYPKTGTCERATESDGEVIY
ncbi:hypothetical protein P5V15_000533 [Pogonomyrmex californicus]